MCEKIRGNLGAQLLGAWEEILGLPVVTEFAGAPKVQESGFKSTEHQGWGRWC